MTTIVIRRCTCGRRGRRCAERGRRRAHEKPAAYVTNESNAAVAFLGKNGAAKKGARVA
jgi:hypothetical protein